MIVSKESPQSDAKKQGNGEVEADLYKQWVEAMGPSPNKQWNPTLRVTEVIII
jgi:hypothetical protein